MIPQFARKPEALERDGFGLQNAGLIRVLEAVVRAAGIWHHRLARPTPVQSTPLSVLESDEETLPAQGRRVENANLLGQPSQQSLILR